MKMHIPTLLQAAGAVVLVGASVVFGAVGQTTEMGLAVLAGAIALAFGNLHRIESFSGGGFKATTRPSDAEQDEPDAPDPEAPNSNETVDIVSLRPRLRHAIRRQASQEVFLAHELYLTARRRNRYDAVIYLRGSAGRGISHVESARFFLGKVFGEEPFEGKRLSDKRLGITVKVRGEFFCTCEVTFVNKERVLLERYIDFGMARVIEGQDPDVY